MAVDMKRKYAQLLVKVGMNVQKDQPVLIEAAQEGWEFANLVAEEAYAAGASRVRINYLDLHKLKLDALHLPVEAMEAYEPADGESIRAYMREKACTIRLETEYPDLMRDLPDDRAHAVFARIDGLRNIMRGMMAQNGTQWCIAVVPNQTWAEKVFPNADKSQVLDMFWRQLYKLCYLDEDCDPAAVWAQKSARHRAVTEKLDELKLRELHFVSQNGTDLTVGLGNMSRFGPTKEQREAAQKSGRVPCQCNIPTEEVCTTPLKYRTNGTVHSTRPLLAGGKLIDRFWIRFRDGKAVDCHAEEGEEMLRRVLATDEGSCYLGEVALVENSSPISQSGLIYYTTLIDENASCHLALGRRLLSAPPEGYTEDGVSDPYNYSQIHIDFMFGAPDMSVVGKTADGKEVEIFRNGDFVI